MPRQSRASLEQRAIEIHTIQADQFEERYDVRLARPYDDCFAYSRHRLNSFLDRYLDEEGSGKSLLDVGCGTGHHLMELRTRGYDVAGVDASDGMLAHARANNPQARIEKAKSEHLPFDSGTFDYVLCIEVLRYLPDPQPTLNEILRVLKPGGTALVTAAPALSLNGYAVINQVSSRLKLGNLTQVRQFFTTSWTLRKQFRAAGFDEIAIHGVYLGAVNWVERLAKPLLPGILRRWEPFDRGLSDRWMLRDVSNMYLVHATRL